MYLEKLEIQGFKSFAGKNVLIFPGMLGADQRGLTAVVGPNGSGKSNVADAVRWALGEQSMKTLRGKKAEDIIFAGTEKKGKLGMAEVSLYLNNEEAVKNKKEGESKNSITDYSQIVITRRLYRDGDSGYMINNNRVRLSDVQMLLARAKFGQKTYSVIGQGMVEGFLNTTLAERKEFFDEATGVKQYQIKRDESLNKLRASYENLIQAQMLVSEIEPRLRSLTRQVGRLHKRGELEETLKDQQVKYYSNVWKDINEQFNKYNKSYLEIEKVKLDKDEKLANLNKKLEELKINSQKDNEFSSLQNELNKIQGYKDELNKKLARVEAQIEMQLEASGQFDLSFLLSRKESLAKDIEQTSEEVNSLENNIKDDLDRSKELEKEKEKIEESIKKISEDLAKVSAEAAREDQSGKTKERWQEVLEILKNIEEENDISKIKEIAIKLKGAINKLASFFGFGEKTNEDFVVKKNIIQEELEKLRQEKENVLIRTNENNLRMSARQERIKLLAEKNLGLKNELENILEKLNKNENKVDFKEVEKEKEDLKKQITDEQEKINKLKEDVNKINKDEEHQREQFFNLQKNIQDLQNEINNLSNELQSLKINSTRYETKLEDLEIEIREEIGELKKIKEYKVESEVEIASLKEKIVDLKKQLELIGGIDPQVEQEYNETKERFDFLTGQINDFNQAVDSLEKIIKELDVVIKKQFDKEFKEIADNFEKYFKILFNGGNAKILKVMDDANEKKEETEEQEEVPKKKDQLEIADIKKIKFLQKHNATGLAGIEIQANPPGKKIGSVSMLSGGERALTAIALISAIISANPSPFVVLDEVDAALDEANSERLAKILDELSHKTQFIVITHNRASMRRASILYGVTMGDDGVSKLLSVKLDEIKDKIGR